MEVYLVVATVCWAVTSVAFSYQYPVDEPAPEPVPEPTEAQQKEFEAEVFKYYLRRLIWLLFVFAGFCLFAGGLWLIFGAFADFPDGVSDSSSSSSSDSDSAPSSPIPSHNVSKWVMSAYDFNQKFGHYPGEHSDSEEDEEWIKANLY